MISSNPKRVVTTLPLVLALMGCVRGGSTPRQGGDTTELVNQLRRAAGEQRSFQFDEGTVRHYGERGFRRLQLY